MSYDLNKKRAIGAILMDIAVVSFLLLIYFLYAGLTDFEKLKMTAQLIIRDLPIPIFILIGGFGVLFTAVNLNIRTLIYKSKKILVINEDSLIYDTFLYKKIEIKKKDIERIYTTTYNDGLLIGGRYIAILTKEPIHELKNRKSRLIEMFRAKSFGHCLYINASELNQNPEKIALEIEKRLAIPIKKKKNDLYFEGKGFMEVSK